MKSSSELVYAQDIKVYDIPQKSSDLRAGSNNALEKKVSLNKNKVFVIWIKFAGKKLFDQLM